MSNLRWKIITIVAVFVVFFGIGVYPILADRYKLPAPQWLLDHQLKLGLDLKGGVHLVLRVQTDDALRVKTEQDSGRLQEELKRRGVPASVAILDVTSFRVDGVPPGQEQAFRQAAEQEARRFRPQPRRRRQLHVPHASEHRAEASRGSGRAGAADHRTARQ